MQTGANVNFVKSNVNSVRHNVNSVRTNVNTGRSKQLVPTSNSNSFSPDHLLKNMEDRGIFNSGCSGHMTGNKDHLDDFEECKGGSVTFGGSKGYITAEPKTHHTSPSPEPDNEHTEHIFEQPSPEHQPLSPRQETKVPQSQDPTHPHVLEARNLIVEDLLHLVPNLITKGDSLEIELKKTKLTMG
ncbi:hypothetical protein Tco_0035984, partial [Tanacetum coccineum]